MSLLSNIRRNIYYSICEDMKNALVSQLWAGDVKQARLFGWPLNAPPGSFSICINIIHIKLTLPKRGIINQLWSDSKQLILSTIHCVLKYTTIEGWDASLTQLQLTKKQHLEYIYWFISIQNFNRRLTVVCDMMGDSPPEATIKIAISKLGGLKT